MVVIIAAMALPARRLVAALTAIVVGWTALWPLVTAAKALLAEDEVILCHQAGSMVAPGEMPMKPDAPGPKPEGQTHCPLCIMAFYGSAPAPLAVPPLQFSTLSVRLEVYDAQLQRSFPVSLPPSRAPPAPLAG